MSARLCSVLLLALPITASAQAYVPAFERDLSIEAGSELVLVYVGASHCGPCLLPEYKAALEQAKVLLAEQAEASGKRFVAVGVSIDYNPDDGFAFLSASGRFDEMVIGRNWFNSAALAHLWRPEGIEERTIGLPTVMVFEREMSMGEAISASEPHYLKHIVGNVALPEWAAAGAPIE